MQVASFWPGLFVSAMQGQDMGKLVCSLPDGGSGGGGGGGGDAAPAAAAAGKAPEGEPDDLNRAWRARVFLGSFHPRYRCALLALHAPLSGGACAREWLLKSVFCVFICDPARVCQSHEKCASVSRPCMRSVVVYSAHTCEARERKNTSFASYFVARAHRHKQGAKMRCVLRPFHHQLCSCIHASLWLCVGCMTAPLLQ